MSQSVIVTLPVFTSSQPQSFKASGFTNPPGLNVQAIAVSTSGAVVSNPQTVTSDSTTGQWTLPLKFTISGTTNPMPVGAAFIRVQLLGSSTLLGDDVIDFTYVAGFTKNGKKKKKAASAKDSAKAHQ